MAQAVFYYNGRYSSDFGLRTKLGMSFPSAARDRSFQAVPGREGRGDLIIDNGRFEMVERAYDCALYPVDGMTFHEQAHQIKQWLQSTFSYGDLTDDRDPGYIRRAVVNNALDLQEVLETFGKAKIIFTCKPFKESILGRQPVDLTASGALANMESFNARPEITVYGSGDITLYVNNQSIILQGVDEYITIDSQLQIAHKGTLPQGSKLRSDWPILLPGVNNISWTGTVSHVSIVPHWGALL